MIFITLDLIALISSVGLVETVLELTYIIPGNPLQWNWNLIQNSEIQNIIIYSE